jgi:hypothetical protein
MIPSMDTLGSAAAEILGSVPAGLARGTVNAGLYGLGFLGKWALPRLQRDGVKIVSCYDANEALTGTFAEGVPVHSASALKLTKPEYLIVTAHHAVTSISAMLDDLDIANVPYDAWYVASNFNEFCFVHDRILRDQKKYCAPS